MPKDTIRQYDYRTRRPVFCQIEVAETVIWLTEAAPRLGKMGATGVQRHDSANAVEGITHAN
ncbi:hypothetical protein PY257_09560 [Ramlibacter sp. H39-3-26]|uniref:hypothetical protein n=1 Tax=Curvibacter soli TaxID=3031331 RepID=UPI0023DA1A03|nr:hypothetical protein [Ramlibacter sp. H39-3-26]MDF1485420.1 hypothetical protein [Ramlibacter sp. H39-3-26]